MKNLIKYLRRQDEKQPAEYDLCGKIHGEYVDIVLCEWGKWRLHYFGKAKEFNTRTEVIDWLEKNGVGAMKYELDS